MNERIRVLALVTILWGSASIAGVQQYPIVDRVANIDSGRVGSRYH
jgi:hypothetical protein